MQRTQGINILGTQSCELVKQMRKRLPFRIFKLCEAVERNKGRILSLFQYDPRTRDLVGLFGVDQMADNIEWRPFG